MRGLKPPTVSNINIGNVASFTDAWIETKPDILIALSEEVASFTDAWIETFLFASMSIILPSRIFYRCVD